MTENSNPVQSDPNTNEQQELSPRKKLTTFISICVFEAMIFTNFQLPYSFLPLYNEERNISSAWTGGILGSTSLGFILGPIFIVPFLLEKFSTPASLSMTACCLGISTILCALLDFLKNLTAFKILAVIARTLAKLCGGCLSAIILSALVIIYINKVGVSTSISEAIINGSLASAPFIGALLYSNSGFMLAFIVPGALALVCSLAALAIPKLSNESTKREEEQASRRKWKSLFDPMLLFPPWHLASAKVLLTYHMPLVPVYAEQQFGADVVWSGAAQLVGAAVVCVSYPILGILIDKFGPYKMLISSCLCLPLVYIFIGPLPLLSFVTPSKTQLMLFLALLGMAVPMACIASLPIMLEVYRAKNQGELPTWAVNCLVSFYCAAHPLGSGLGPFISGFIAPHATFGWSTGVLGLIYIGESILGVFYCVKVKNLINTAEKRHHKSVVYQNKGTIEPVVTS